MARPPYGGVGERHVASREPRAARRACNACSRRFSHRCKRVKLPLEVTALDVAMPLALTLDGDAVVFAIATAVELGPEVGRRDAHR
jgi:hypothetical protein